MEEITIQSTSWHSANVLEPITIYEKERTRFVFIAETNDAKIEKGETVSGNFVYQRKLKNQEWETVNEIKLSEIKSGESIKWHFSSEQIKKLYDGLTKLYTVANNGIPIGITKWTIADTERLIEVPEDRIDLIKELLKKDYGQEVWDQLVNENPDLATKLSLGRLQAERQKIVEVFRENIEVDNPEGYWQKFFSENDWIFGYGLRYVFLQLLTDQPNYGQANFTGKETQRGDFLVNTSACVKYTILVEIKKPNSKIFKTESGNIKNYRNGASQLSEEFIGAVSQLQVNCMSWEKTARYDENHDELSGNNINTVNPKGILIIGNTKEFSENTNARNTFELFRSQISGIEIMTFDELYNRSKFIVEEKENIGSNQELDDFPF